MKRNLLFMSVLASLFLVGCSQKEIVPGGEDNGKGSGSSFINVNLVSYGNGTRAISPYEDGTDEENKVTKVRFYFFTETGGPANVKLNGSSYVNYYDWTPGKDDVNPGSNPDIEKKLSATIVIRTPAGDQVPQRIAAVLNPTENAKSRSLSELQSVAADYANGNFTREGQFVMFNSVYAEGSDEIVPQPILAKNLCTTEADAKDNPVTLYVERSVAKVSLGFGDLLDSNHRMQIKDKDGNAVKVPGVDGQQINVYLEIKGWGLTAETDKGRLVKKIDASWDGNWWKGSYRSFWAINAENAANQYHKYTDIPEMDWTTPPHLYTNENAGQLAGKQLNKTKFIINGNICDENGNALTLVRHLGVHFADVTSSSDENENFKSLKNSILKRLEASGKKYYVKETTGESDNALTTFRQIDAGDIKIVKADQKTQEDSNNNCYVYAQLTDAAANLIWYTNNEPSVENPTASASDINNALKNKDVVDWGLVWNSGMTYYYDEIKHITDSKMTGVVRNHIYKVNITKIAGLGTPVYDPEEVIYPEKPEKNDHYIAAEIKILSWRVVTDNYELEW
ncbi:Mfa1 family fimbria major subunit [uncultured Phocaeicola sp.]|uniref:Mfa1 family fimbria major subunit n=1 Tax=uncultured Phocaeicola sp. TaxID=990718 RepID=UPI0025A5FA3E|nr:Mfa1 family fimbria major subunit [uncultured Phocaeicola sp.]